VSVGRLGQLRVLVISFSVLASDSRVRRQLQAIDSEGARVTVAGYGGLDLGDVEIVSVTPAWSVTAGMRPLLALLRRAVSAVLLLLRQHELEYWTRRDVREVVGRLGGRSFDLVIANDLDALPAAARISRDGALVFDAHEYSPAEFEDRFLWRCLRQPQVVARCRRYLPSVSAAMTVEATIRDRWQERFGIEMVVVRNAPPFEDLAPSETADDTIRLIHHGGAIRSRRLELMLDLMEELDDRFRLDLMLMPTDARYLTSLMRRAAGDPRIRFRAPVPITEICAATNRYDVGLFLLPPTNFNYAHALPNKFFEYVQARLAVAVGPTPAMAGLVREHRLGVVSPTFEVPDMARALNTLSRQDVVMFKAEADRAARELCFEREAGNLLSVLRRALEARTP
jgi:hypothetical protein